MAAAMNAGKIAYFDGNYVPIEEANISVMTHAFNYGTGLFEGIRGYYNEDENAVLIFKLHEHCDRMKRNCKVLCLDVEETTEDFEKICTEVVSQGGFTEGVYIRPIVYKSDLSLGPKLNGVGSSVCCYAIALGEYVDVQKGLEVCVSSWRRLMDNSIPGRLKGTGSYINSSLIRTEAETNGYDDAIVLREDGTVAEGSAMNLFMVQDGVLYTTPPTADILVGITRKTIMELAENEFGLKVVERPIARTELYVCDELMVCGTGVEVSHIRSVDRRTVGNGERGPITAQLQELYFDVVKGKVEKYRHWCTPVKAAELAAS